MSNDDEEIRLRDQFAIAAMQALVNEHQPYKTLIAGRDLSEGKNSYTKRIDVKIENISTIAYKIADSMRKARLKSFG